jgi:MFS family permease
VAATLTLFLFGSGVPSPLYEVYQHRFRFSPTTLTAVFAVYALALLSTLIPAGSLSDRAGRRPVIFVALVLQIASTALFLAAGGVGLLYAARIVQGVAVGAATGALAAALVDLQPAEGALGPLTITVAPPLGLAVGALSAGVLVQLAPAPLRAVYWVELGLLVAAGSAMALLVPETVRRAPSPWRAIDLRVRIPPRARRPFVAVAPGLIATWALGGLFFSLGPDLTIVLLGAGSHIVGALVPATLSVASALAAVLARGWDGRRSVVYGTLALAAGVGVTLIGIRAASTAPLFLGAVLAGAGFGPAFGGTLRTLTPLAAPEARGELLAAVYLVSYLAFSIPVVLAGLLVSPWGRRDTASAYAVAIIALALLAAGLTARWAPSGPEPAPAVAGGP